MDDDRADHQDIRPLNILILNLMPQKMVTETQILRHLANTPLQLTIEFLYMDFSYVKDHPSGAYADLLQDF